MFQFVASKREKTYIGDLGQVKNVYHDVTFVCQKRTASRSSYHNMADENLKGDSIENSTGSENPDNQEYYECVRKLLRPVENRWQYIQSVLLWQKPSHSLSYFIAMTILVG